MKIQFFSKYPTLLLTSACLEYKVFTTYPTKKDEYIIFIPTIDSIPHINNKTIKELV